ncbi:MAG: hypothetical protein KAS71_03735, partial [Bacteroidales bacterium]|nr:hypothetical protein [Bacteroidales bacterium]
MKISKYLFVLILSGISIISFSQENLLLNPGFESGHSVDYILEAKNGSIVDFSGTADPVFEGDSALSIDITTVGSGGPQVILFKQSVSSSLVDQSKSHTFTFALYCAESGLHFRSRIEGSVRLDMSFETMSGYHVYKQTIPSLPTPHSTDAYIMSIQFGYLTENDGKTFIVDDLSFYEERTGSLDRVFVSPNGDDSNEGNLISPVKTLDMAFTLLGGDTIFLLEGTYYDNLVLGGKTGTADNPIVIMSYEGANVIFDGTKQLSDTWELTENQIYKTNPDFEVWQLFVDDELQMPARWPNAFLSDSTVWDRENYWAHGNEALSTNGTEMDDPSGNNDLAASGIDATGSLAVLNVGSWKTWAREVFSHSPGSSTFTYDPVPGTYKTKHHYYYFVGTLELLDAPGEWCYVDSTNELFLRCSDDLPPANRVKGKAQSFAMQLNNCHYIQVRDINFFGTTIELNNCTNSLVENCNFDYPSASKRALMNNSEPDVTASYGSTNTPTRNIFRNNVIKNTESHAIYWEGMEDRVENNHFENIDWVVADRPGLMNSIYLDGQYQTFSRNYIQQCGASSTIKPGNFPIVEYNNACRTGFLQSDGSITQVVINGQPGSQIRYNWFHNTVKSGARFDAPIPPVVWGYGGYMHHNLVWETGSGLMLKGERHYAINNTVFNTNNNGIIILDDSDDNGGGNVGTITMNNFSDEISGHRSDYLSIPGEASHNWNGYEEPSNHMLQMNDPANFDFRPLPGSGLIDGGEVYPAISEDYFGEKPDMGAYEYGDSIYWIGGRFMEKTSYPIPMDKGRSNTIYTDLMWQFAYNAVSYDVYFGTSLANVTGATKNSEEFIVNQSVNIFYPGHLTKGGNYFWRVDAIHTDGSIIKGDVWEFEALYESNLPKDTISFKVFKSEDGNVELMENALVSVGGQSKLTNIEGCAQILLDSGMYTYSISAAGFETASNSFITEDTMSITDTLISSFYDVSIVVMDDFFKDNPVSGTNVNFSGETLITDSEGEVSYLDYVFGDYNIDISKEGYLNYNGTLSISSDTSIVIYLNPELNDVTLYVINNVSLKPVFRAELL